jgi:hypothetical protein
MNEGETFHYIVYVADGVLGSYVTDNSGDVVINYDPIDVSSCGYTPADITGIYIGTSKGCYLTNIAYTSIKIYKGDDSSSSYNSFRYNSDYDHYLLTYLRAIATRAKPALRCFRGRL